MPLSSGTHQDTGASRIRTRCAEAAAAGPRLISPTYLMGNIELCDSTPRGPWSIMSIPRRRPTIVAALGAALALVTTSACSGGSSDVVGAAVTQAPAAAGSGG